MGVASYMPARRTVVVQRKVAALEHERIVRALAAVEHLAAGVCSMLSAARETICFIRHSRHIN